MNAFFVKLKDEQLQNFSTEMGRKMQVNISFEN